MDKIAVDFLGCILLGGVSLMSHLFLVSEKMINTQQPKKTIRL